jgi:hypothetical protein
MSNNWGTITWYLLHGLSRKIKQDKFDDIIDSFIHIFIELLNNLPCPECSMHALLFISKVNFQNIKKKEDLENILFELHNHANKNIKRPIENISILKMYDKLNLQKTVQSFNQVFNTNGNMVLLTQTYHRTIFIRKFNAWFNQNKDNFTI